MRFVHLFVIMVSKKTHVFSPIPCFQKATSEFNVTIQLSKGCDVVFDAVISLCCMNVDLTYSLISIEFFGDASYFMLYILCCHTLQEHELKTRHRKRSNALAPTLVHKCNCDLDLRPLTLIH